MGDEIQVFGTVRRYSKAMPRHPDTGMQQRGCADLEGRSEQGPCAYTCGVSSTSECERVGEETEMPHIPSSTGGVPDVAETLLGTALLVDRLWSVECGCSERKDNTGIPEASSGHSECR